MISSTLVSYKTSGWSVQYLSEEFIFNRFQESPRLLAACCVVLDIWEVEIPHQHESLRAQCLMQLKKEYLVNRLFLFR